jgi:tight adherence protein C
MILYIVIGLIVIAAVMIYFAFAQPSTEQQKQRRREELLGETTQQQRSAISEELSASFYERIVQPTAANISNALAAAAPEGMIKTVRTKLQAAGHPANINEPVFLLMRGLAALAGSGAAYTVFQLLEGQKPLMRIVVTIFVLGAIGIAPDYWINNRMQARKNQIRRALPDLLDLLVVCTEAGMGIDGAIAEVVKRKQGPLVDEFNRTLVEVRLGKRRNEAWQDMAERVQVQELSTLVAALYQAQSLGVSIANALRAHADALRNQRSIRIKEQAAVLPTKMLFPLVLCIFPALFVVVLGPGAIKIMETLGQGFGGG